MSISFVQQLAATLTDDTSNIEQTHCFSLFCLSAKLGIVVEKSAVC